MHVAELTSFGAKPVRFQETLIFNQQNRQLGIPEPDQNRKKAHELSHGYTPVILQRILKRLLHFLLERGEPLGHEMYILQDDPVAARGGHGHGLLGHHLLALAQ